MTRDEARALVPVGWVECDELLYVPSMWRWKLEGYHSDGRFWVVHAIPAPKSEPRRVPCGEMVVEFDDDGWPCFKGFWTGPTAEAFANTKWLLNHETREWVEVLDEA